MKNQIQEVEVGGEERKKRSSNHVFMANHEVNELTWENGQLAIHGLSGLLSTKPMWGRASDTLESIVHQATSSHNYPISLSRHHDSIVLPAITSSTLSFSTEKSSENPELSISQAASKKRMRDQYRGNSKSNFLEERGSACASGSRENDDTIMMTWASLEECPPTLKAKTMDEDSACHDGSENVDNEEQRDTKGETSGSKSTRRCRAAANHNQSERRRRDKINQKMKALQRLVPNASKSDKASMLDEVIEYLKQLQAQVKMMSTKSLTPQMMMPSALGMQQQQMQMSLLAASRMGMGIGSLGLGMGPVGPPPGMSSPQVASSPFFSPQFVMPPMMPSHAPNATTINNNTNPFNNPYCPFFAQPMNMEVYNKMVAIYQQQLNQTTQPTSNPMPPSNVQGG